MPKEEKIELNVTGGASENLFWTICQADGTGIQPVAEAADTSYWYRMTGLHTVSWNATVYQTGANKKKRWVQTTAFQVALSFA
jgi:hypothetical protein